MKNLVLFWNIDFCFDFSFITPVLPNILKDDELISVISPIHSLSFINNIFEVPFVGNFYLQFPLVELLSNQQLLFVALRCDCVH